MTGDPPILRRPACLAVVLTLLLGSCAAAGPSTAHNAPPATTKATTLRTAAAKRATAPPDAPRAPTPSRAAAQGAPPSLPPPPKPDVAYWATPQPVVDEMLKLVEIRASDVIYDLGCGDARSLVTAAKRYGAKGFGFDLDPRLVAEARRNVRQNGVEDLVVIEQANVFEIDLSPADVIFLYLVPRLNFRLVPQLEKLRPGSRIVSHEYEIPGTRPTRIVRVPGPPDGPPDAAPEDVTVMHKIYLWTMPWQRVATDWATE